MPLQPFELNVGISRVIPNRDPSNLIRLLSHNRKKMKYLIYTNGKNMLLRTILVLLAAIGLSACGSIPMTIDGLRLQQQEIFTVCSHRSVQEATAQLARAWSKCYVGPEVREVAVMVGRVPVMVPVGSAGTMRVDVQSVRDGTTVFVTMPGGNIPLMADIRTTANCPSEVVARGVQALWVSSAKNTETWLNNPEASGPMMACK